VLPKIWAALGENIGFQQAFWILVPCYLFILYFATYGYKWTAKKKATL